MRRQGYEAPQGNSLEASKYIQSGLTEWKLCSVQTVGAIWVRSRGHFSGHLSPEVHKIIKIGLWLTFEGPNVVEGDRLLITDY